MMTKKTQSRKRQDQVSPTTQPQKYGRIKIAVDVHLQTYVVCRQYDASAPQPAQRMPREKFVAWVLAQKDRAEKLYVCYEAGCFGFVLARALIAAGVEVYVIAPQNWDQTGKGKTDKLDVQAMVLRLEQYVNGNRRAFSVVRIPTVAQERLRSESRQREQFLAQRKALQAQGRSLLLVNGVVVRGQWWKTRPWGQLRGSLPAELVPLLEGYRQLLLVVDQQVETLGLRLAQAAAQCARPVAFGAMSYEMLRRELFSFERFTSARKVGSYFGLCPGEDSSGNRRRQLSIHKHGNPRLRVLMVEAVWRFLQYQREYWAIRKWQKVLGDPKAGAAARKRAVIAVARNLAVDLWRLEMKKTTAEKLGLKMQAFPELPTEEEAPAQS
jgi:transposase